MANMSNTLGEGGSGGNFSDKFSDTGYGTHDGKGNVPTGAQFDKGTGYDEHGQVATSFGKWQVAYDPVTGMAVDNDSVTAGYDFPAGGDAGGGGLVDVSAPAAFAGTGATPDMQRQLQEFFAAARQQQGEAQPTAGGEEAEQAAADIDGDEGAGDGGEEEPTG